MYVHFKPSSQIFEFMQQFQEEKRNQIAHYLLVLGMDIALKLGQKNPKELYQTLKQLAKNIEADHKSSNSTELREEIKKIQHQLVQLNSLFQTDSNRPQNRFYTQNDYEDPQFHFQSPDQNRMAKDSLRTSKRSHRTKSPNFSNTVTAKITESPPPPVLYIQNVNTKLHVKPHLDDHQIKQLLYSENEYLATPFESQRNPHNSPPTIRYTIELNSDKKKDRHQTKKKARTQQSKSRGKRLPPYLQNVESKIKPELDHDKMAYKQQLQYSQQPEQTADFSKKRNQTQNIQSSTETYYEIQQYLKNYQQNPQFDYSPVQEMKAENQQQNVNSKSSFKIKPKSQNYFDQQEEMQTSNPIKVTDFQMSKQQSSQYEQSFDPYRGRPNFQSPYQSDVYQKKQKTEEESSDTFSNFTPPNKEVREFFQKQFVCGQ